MPDVWTVSPSAVQRNGGAIAGYVAHSLILRSNTEHVPFTEVALVVRVIDPHSEAAREAPLATLTTNERSMVLAEYAQYPSFSEYKSKPGDTINFSGSFTTGLGEQPTTTIAGTDLL